MKFSELMPTAVPAQEKQLSALTGFLSMVQKSQANSGMTDTYKSPTFGIDQIVNSWIRQQVAFRYQLMMDLYVIATQTTEIRTPIDHIVSEVFRRGIKWKEKFAVKCVSPLKDEAGNEKEEDGKKVLCNTEHEQMVEECPECGGTDIVEPDKTQQERLKEFLSDCNQFDQSLEEVLRQLLFDAEALDDAFLYLQKEYKGMPDESVRSVVRAVRRLHPAVVEFDLDAQGLPKNAHFVCYIHRNSDGITQTQPGMCAECGRELVPAMYIYWNGKERRYLLDSEIIHFSIAAPSETYGWSKVMTIFEQALSLIGMTKCYDEKTDVLTRAGWKNWKDVTMQDEFATRLPSGELVYEKPVGVYKFPYKGKMYSLKNRYLDLLVTPNHRMYVQGKKDKDFTFKEAKDVFGQPVRYLRGTAPKKYFSIGANTNHQDDSWEDYDGMVYCTEIPNGLLYVRRNGKTVWSGNSLYRYFFERRMPACYSSDTDVLTSDGWKRFRDISSNDEFATFDENRNLIYERPISVVKQSYSGPMYHLKARSLDLLVTPNHRMYVSKRYGKNASFGFETADDVLGKPRYYMKGGTNWVGVRREKFILPSSSYKDGRRHNGFTISLADWATLLGCWYSFGGVNDPGKVYFTKTTPELLRVIDKLPIKWNAFHTQSGIIATNHSLFDALIPYSKHKESLLLSIRDWPNDAKTVFAQSANVTRSSRNHTQYNSTQSILAERLEEFKQGFSYVSVNGSANKNVHVEAEKHVRYFPDVEIDMDTWLEFFGYWLSEGCVLRNGTMVEVAQSLKANPEKYEKIRKCLYKMPFKWHDGKNGFRCHDVRLANYLRQFGRSAEKFVPRELMELEKKQLEILFDAWILGDAGSTNSERLRDDMCEIAFKLGLGSSYRIQKYPGDWKHQTYNCGFSLGELMGANTQRTNDEFVDYEGMVYCVQIPSGILYVRRNGKEAWSGNSMLMVFTDDPEGLRRERDLIAARTKTDPNYIPMVAVSSKSGARGRAEMIRLFHTLQEMDYLPVRQEIRERVAATWGVTPAWQGAPEAFGGLSTQTSQLTVMSRVVEGVQRIFHEKVFPELLDSFGITDWKLELPQPEEQAESTRLMLAQQKVAIAQMLWQMGFEVKPKSNGMDISDIDFLVSGEAKSLDQMQGGMGGMGGGVDNSQNPENQEEGMEEQSDGRSDVDDKFPITGAPLGLMEKASLGAYIVKAQNWITQLMQKGHTAPDVRQVAPDGSKVWFKSAGIDYVAYFNNGSLIDVEKAVMTQPPTVQTHGKTEKKQDAAEVDVDDDG